jgi:hypothetical protein
VDMTDSELQRFVTIRFTRLPWLLISPEWRSS